MLAIDVKSGAVGIAVLFAIYHYLKHSAGPARWADSTRSYHFQHLREHLLAAAAEPEHPRDWRPQLLAFSDDSHRRGQLLAFASWIEGGSGLTTAVRVLEGEGVKMLKLREEAEEELRNDLALHGSKAFPLVIVAPNLQIGIRTLVQSYGVGPLKANTVLLNWFENLPEGILGLKEHRYSRNLRVAFRLGSNIIIFYAQEEAWKALDTLSPEDHRIDVWWWGDATSRLMLLLAYLMKRNETWHKATIRLFAGAHDSEHEETPASIEKMLEDVRIEAKAEVVPNINADVIAQRSADATLVFLPFRLKGSQIMGCPGDPLANTLSRLPMVASVLAAQDIDLDAEPEEGKAAEVASALDALANAKKNAKDAEKQAAEAADRADEALHQMRDAVLSGADEEILKEVEAAAREAKEQAIKTARRAAKALVKADDAARTVEGLGVLPAEEPEEPDKSSNAKNPRV
jgi:hypothetical protein